MDNLIGDERTIAARIERGERTFSAEEVSWLLETMRSLRAQNKTLQETNEYLWNQARELEACVYK